jgi:hypothetical protein
MAIVEIAKIQVRRGDARSQGMPQLDTGEFGWAISGTDPDSTVPELFIGNKSEDGATVTTNTRILTVLDLPNIFTISISTSSYYYEGHRSVAVYTGAGDTNLSRTVKDKLDDFVTLYDFIPPNVRLDPEIDYAEIFQRAIDQLYLNSDKLQSFGRTILKIPAGEYYLGSPLYLPSYATLQGEGKDKTTLIFISSATSCIQFVDLTSTVGGYVTINDFESTSSPRGIVIKGMTISYDIENSDRDASLPLIYADGCEDSMIDDVKFKGKGSSTLSNIDHSGIKIRGLGGITSRNLRITNSIFESLYYGIYSEDDIEDTVIDNCKFENLHRGVNYDINSPSITGPVRSRITRNIFNTIYEEAVFIGGDESVYTNHILSQNSYINVGNNSSYDSPGDGDLGDQATPVITFETSGNVSDYDSFDRNLQVNSSPPTAPNFIIPVAGHASLIDHRVTTFAIINTSATGDVVKIAYNGTTTNIKLQYQITASGITRWGELRVVCSQGSIVDVTDDYNYTGGNDTGIVFSGIFDSPTNTITIQYAGNTVSGTFTYQLNQFY